jgi:hypothetical protein
MRIDDPISLARTCRTARQAARAMAALEAEISLADGRPEAWYLDADRAIDSLRQRFPGATQLDAYTEPPGLSPTARKRLWSDPPAAETEEATDADPVFDRLPSGREPRRRPRPRRGIRHALEAAGLLAALAAAIALLVRHARRHPKHAVAGGVVLVALASGRPHLIVTAGVIATMIALVRRRPGALNPPRPPRAPRTPSALRMPAPPRWPR